MVFVYFIIVGKAITIRITSNWVSSKTNFFPVGQTIAIRVFLYIRNTILVCVGRSRIIVQPIKFDVVRYSVIISIRFGWVCSKLFFKCIA